MWWWWWGISFLYDYKYYNHVIIDVFTTKRFTKGKTQLCGYCFWVTNSAFNKCFFIKIFFLQRTMRLLTFFSFINIFEVLLFELLPFILIWIMKVNCRKIIGIFSCNLLLHNHLCFYSNFSKKKNEQKNAFFCLYRNTYTPTA